nr:hypothetical protein GCM10017547_24700 [Pseudarthrobacter oxydans]
MTDAVLDLLTDKDQPGWANLLERGATFTWEAWHLVEGTDYSQSHAWSASVVKEILDHLLGVRFSSPGGSELLIEPPLCRLNHASGTVPVNNGYVEAGWTRDGGQMRLECTVPAGTAAVVRLPAGKYTVTSGDTHPTAEAAVVPSAAEAAGTQPAEHATRDFRVHAGTWSFTPRA